MKHNLKITLILLLMFVVTQFIGLYVSNYYLGSNHPLPYGLETPSPSTPTEFNLIFSQILIAFVIAIALIFFLSEFKIEFILKLWFFAVIVIALALALNSFMPNFKYAYLVALIVALPLGIFKIYRQNILVHNLTELLVYPGIASVFIPLLNIYTVILFLVLISAYDIWAVWHSGIMQKMAKYQINNLKIFSGFFVPYMNKNLKARMKKLKPSQLKKKKIKVNVAILGGGDVVFPIITAGVMLKTLGLYSALLVLAGATLGLGYLFFVGKKKKFYPAMPFITVGILLGIGASYLITLF